MLTSRKRESQDSLSLPSNSLTAFNTPCFLRPHSKLLPEHKSHVIIETYLICKIMNCVIDIKDKNLLLLIFVCLSVPFYAQNPGTQVHI